MDLGDRLLVDPESGHFISEKHQRIAEIIHDYDPNVHLVWIPPRDRTNSEDEMPFAIIHTPPGKPEYIVFKFKEEELDERILARLWSNDASKNNPMAYLEALEAAQQAVDYKKRLEMEEERKDIARSMFNSPLNYYRYNGKKLRLG